MSNDGLSVCLNEPLARHTAWRTGGRCDAFVVVHRREALPEVLKECKEVGWSTLILGQGTRTVVRDGGVDGAVIRLGTDFCSVETVDSVRLRVGAGAPMGAIVARALQLGLGGLEVLQHAAGTLGASLLCDAGWDGLADEVYVLRRGKEVPVEPEAVLGKRSAVITGALLHLPKVGRDAAEAALRRARQARAATPLSSWVEPPKKGSLRAQIRAADLMQVRLRSVAIPEEAPELLVNLGSGTAADLKMLHKSLLDRVKQRRGLTLNPRIRWVGNR